MNKKKGGFIVVSELILIATILVIGLIVGLVEVRDAVVAELEDVAEAIGNMDQGYTFDGVTHLQITGAQTAGTAWDDAPDVAAGDQDPITYNVVPTIDEVSALEPVP